MNDLSEKAKSLLHEGGFTFALTNGEKTFTSDKRGVAPVLMLLETDSRLLKGAYIADRVIGKAAALLLIYGGVNEIYADTVSSPAVEICKSHNIPLFYKDLVPLIKNRTGEGMCPMEASVLFIDNPARAFEVIAELYKKMTK